jgi:hypothetical protein
MLFSSPFVLLGALAADGEAQAVPLWGRWGHSFTAAGGASPETELTIHLTAPSGREWAVPGYWDGAQRWAVRFMPDEEGEWSYRTTSQPAAPGLHGEAGRFECRRVRGQGRFLEHGPVRVAADGHYFAHADGTPFFWLGDTVWNGAMLSSKADWDVYLKERVGKQFSAVQFVLVAPWRTAPANAEGEVAYTGREQIEIHPHYFRRIDERIDAVNARGMLAVPVLLWAIKGDVNPGWSLPEDQAIRLARYLVARYGAHHVAWILPGDGNYSGEVAEKWKRIGRAVFGEGDHAPVTLHPGGMQWPYDAFREEKWLDYLGYQSGHGDDDAAWRWTHSGPPATAWKQKPSRPIVNLEYPYEDHISYQSKQRHSATNIRRAAYWSLLSAPPAGLTYGGHGLWSWQTEEGLPYDHPSTGSAKPWHEAVKLPGSLHMKHLAALFTSLPWWQLRPDDSLLTAQPGGDDPARHVAAARTENGGAALVYLPAGGEVALKAEALPEPLQAEWFDPRTGERQPASGEAGRFRAPDEQDWVLVLRRGA